MKENIVIYTSSLCSVCPLVKDFFTMQQISYTEINIDFQPIKRLSLIAQTKQLRVPQTNINGEWVGGFHPEKFCQLLSK